MSNDEHKQEQGPRAKRLRVNCTSECSPGNVNEIIRAATLENELSEMRTQRRHKFVQSDQLAKTLEDMIFHVAAHLNCETYDV